MFIRPSGTSPTADQVKELDDAFLVSDPAGYYRSRILALLDQLDSEHPQARAPGLAHQSFAALLGDVADAPTDVADGTTELQVVIDALVVRHHAAEALLRLLCARLRQRRLAEPSSLWLLLLDTPTRNQDLVDEVREDFNSDGFLAVASGQLLPLPDGTPLTHEMQVAVVNCLNWIGRAAHLLSGGPLDLNAVNNKVKHGLAVSATNQLRLTFTTVPPDSDGNPVLSSLTGAHAFDIFDVPVVQYVSRPASRPKQGWERTLLRADPAVLLAEAWVLSVIHGAMFHVLGSRYFGDRTDARPPAYPGLPSGLTPEGLLGGSPVGMRFPVTFPPGGGPPLRPTGLALYDSFIPLDIGDGREGVVVDG